MEKQTIIFFRVYQLDKTKKYVLKNERILDVTCYGRAGRENIQLKSKSNTFIKKLSECLSDENPSTKFNNYDLSSLVENNNPSNATFKFGIYLYNLGKEHIIMEREVNVEKFYPVNLYSLETYWSIFEIVDEIEAYIIDRYKKMTYDELLVLDSYHNFNANELHKLSKNS